MESLDFVVRLFMFCCLLFLIVECVPKMYIDVKADYQYLKENRKGSTESESAERVKKNKSNYNISEFRNIHNLERWE